MRIAFPSLLALSALTGFSTANPAAVAAPKECDRCIFLIFFFNELPKCVFETNSGPADPGALLSSGTPVPSANFGKCQPVLGGAISFMSYTYLAFGDTTGCSVVTYDLANCMGSGNTVSLADNNGKCQSHVPKSFKVTCPPKTCPK